MKALDTILMEHELDLESEILVILECRRKMNRVAERNEQ